jgi:hypothetical protein
MKSKDGGLRGSNTGRRYPPMRISPMPMEWMDPMSWRLPSGKALAEFALQAGFLAPLMLGGPRFKRKKPVVTAGTDKPGVGEKQVHAVDRVAIDQVMEEPEHSGTFR